MSPRFLVAVGHMSLNLSTPLSDSRRQELWDVLLARGSRTVIIVWRLPGWRRCAVQPQHEGDSGPHVQRDSHMGEISIR
jgi:hypothetical protein